jgi:hypothetical protein
VGSDLPFRVTYSRIDLSDDASVDALIEAIKAQRREFGKPIKVVAIDTLASALGNKGDENSPEVMNPVLANCHRIREASRGCCLILVHHPGKSAARGPRGFSGIGGTVSTLIEIQYTKGDKVRRVIVQKQRDLELCEDMLYRLQPIELKIGNRRNRPVTSCIVVPLLDATERAAAVARGNAARLSKQQRLALDALRDALGQHGLDIPNGKPAPRVVSQRNWRDVFRSRFPADTAAGTVTKALRRAREALLTAGLIGVAGKQAWVVLDLG